MIWKTNKIQILSVIILFFGIVATAQEVKLKGKVLFDTTPLKDINVLNKDSQSGVATDDNGHFELKAMLGDSILFSSLSFQNRIIVVSENHIENKTMEVYLELGFTELDEVELVQWFRLELGDVAVDERARLNNDQTDDYRPPNASYFVDPTAKHEGISARSIYRALTKNSRHKKAEQKKLDDKMASLIAQFPEKLKSSYGLEFFTISLKVPEDEVDRFLDFCDGNGLANYYDRSSFEVTDFLIKQGTAYTLAKN
jgi:hypothetical protein